MPDTRQHLRMTQSPREEAPTDKRGGGEVAEVGAGDVGDTPFHDAVAGSRTSSVRSGDAHVGVGDLAPK